MLVLSAAPAAKASVKLDTWTNPPSGAAGSSNTNIVGTAFPAGTIAPASVNISIATSCSASLSGTGATKTTALRVTKVLGTSERIEFLIPASITSTGNYFVSITGVTTTGTTFTSSPSCSEVTITAVTKGLSSCLPSSSSAYSPGRRPCKLMSRMVVGVAARPVSNSFPSRVPVPRLHRHGQYRKCLLIEFSDRANRLHGE